MKYLKIEEEMRVRLTLTEEALGMTPNSRKVMDEYIASKSGDEEKAEEEENAVRFDPNAPKTKTVFPRDSQGRPFFWDYQIRGMFKGSMGMLRRIKGTECSKVKAYKKLVDGEIFVKEREIPILFEGEVGDCQRPLRADTPQGSQIALADSETVPAGSVIEFTVCLMDKEYEKAVLECLDYGELLGIGQWRSSGKGRYAFEILDTIVR